MKDPAKEKEQIVKEENYEDMISTKPSEESFHREGVISCVKSCWQFMKNGPENGLLDLAKQ